MRVLEFNYQSQNFFFLITSFSDLHLPYESMSFSALVPWFFGGFVLFCFYKEAGGTKRMVHS